MYYGLHTETEGYHSRSGWLESLDADNLEVAIKEASKISTKLLNGEINIVEDETPFNQTPRYVYPRPAYDDHENWHGKIVARFKPKFIPYTGMGGYYSYSGIEDINNWTIYN